MFAAFQASDNCPTLPPLYWTYFPHSDHLSILSSLISLFIGGKEPWSAIYIWKPSYSGAIFYPFPGRLSLGASGLMHRGLNALTQKCYIRQFCTPPHNILSVGIFKTSNVLGSIPTVAVPNPDHPPLAIYLTQFVFSTKNKCIFTSKIYLLGFCWHDH